MTGPTTDHDLAEDPTELAAETETPIGERPGPLGSDLAADPVEFTTEAASDGDGVAGRRRLGSRARRGGVAPYVSPPSRWARWRRRSGWRRQGFVPLSPGREKRRHRVLPRTAIGISFMLCSFGAGVGMAGAAFYAYYDDRLAANEEQVTRFVETFDTQFGDATGALDQLRSESLDQIRAELGPLEDYVEDRNGVVELPAQLAPSVRLVRTLDDEGEPISGTAFAVVGHNGGTALITSWSVVRAASVQPAPVIELVAGDQVSIATLWAWDPANDLALLVTDDALPLLDLAGPDSATRTVGRAVFATSGIGSVGVTVSPGTLLDRAPDGLQHSALVGGVHDGGPLVDADGRALGMVSSTVGVPGADLGPIGLAVDAARFCDVVLRCPDGSPTGVADPTG